MNIIESPQTEQRIKNKENKTTSMSQSLYKYFRNFSILILKVAKINLHNTDQSDFPYLQIKPQK